METFAVIFAALGAGMILFALTYVTLLVGALVNGMVVLMSGPLIDKIGRPETLARFRVARASGGLLRLGHTRRP